MVSGVTKVVITGAGPEGGDVEADELCPLPVELPLLDGAVVVAWPAAAPVVEAWPAAAVALALSSLPDEHPPSRRPVTANAELNTATRRVEGRRREARRDREAMALVESVTMAVPLHRFSGAGRAGNELCRMLDEMQLWICPSSSDPPRQIGAGNHRISSSPHRG